MDSKYLKYKNRNELGPFMNYKHSLYEQVYLRRCGKFSTASIFLTLMSDESIPFKTKKSRCWHTQNKQRYLILLPWNRTSPWVSRQAPLAPASCAWLWPRPFQVLTPNPTCRRRIASFLVKDVVIAAWMSQTWTLSALMATSIASNSSPWKKLFARRLSVLALVLLSRLLQPTIQFRLECHRIILLALLPTRCFPVTRRR